MQWSSPKILKESNIKLNKDLGFYLPCFFIVQIMDKQNIFRTLTHELIHFLQDISTTYGLIGISRTVDEIKELNRLYLNDNPTIELSEVYKINRQIQNSILGYGAEVYKQLTNNTKVVSVVCKESNPIKCLEADEDIFISEVTVYLEDRTIDYQDSYHIGALSIMESMAHLIETHCYGKKCNTKSFPYDIISMIVEYVVPNFTKEPLAISELCEATLMYYDPAKTLYDALHKIKESNFKHKKPGDTYKYVLENYFFRKNTKKVSALEHFHEFALQTAMTQVDSLITVEPYMDEHLASTWINNAKILRSDITTNITSLCYASKDALFDIYKFIGIPLIIENGEAKTSESNDKQSLLLYPVMSTFLISLLNQEESISCSLCEYCAHNTDLMNYDSLCNSSPWDKKANEQLQCPFLNIKKMWGFENRIISRVKSN